MGDFQHNEGSGSMFKNGYKKKDSHPDYKGEIRADKDIKQGDIIKLSAWEKTTKNGGSYFGLAIDNYQKPTTEEDSDFPSDDVSF